ncbi:hypothetical protein [Sphingomonas sp. TREG-RG-20F-R18-01]|uniref:hypothetical protein n=1 Tax=Sphingomonas sp. TREG-RG-20F-R18-01 TaxID=2914982 RepID=UPI001F581E3B|nr:hypothetical protein [Sphingomonas sp. TREG-RG-20F-R18-01]
MTQFFMLFLGALLIGLMGSTKDGRAAARKRMQPYTFGVGAITAAAVILIIAMG